MSSRGSSYGGRNGRAGRRRQLTSLQISGVDTADSFKVTAPRTGGRHSKGFMKSEVGKSEANHFTETIQEHEQPVTSSLNTVSDPSGYSATNQKARSSYSLDKNTLAHVNGITVNHGRIHKICHDEAPTPIEVSQSESDTNGPSKVMKVSPSEASSVEILVGGIPGCASKTDCTASCWVRGAEEIEKACCNWNDSGQDIDEYVNPLPSINNLAKRVPHSRDQKSASAKFGLAHNLKKLLYNEKNFPPLPSPTSAIDPNKATKAKAIESKLCAEPNPNTLAEQPSKQRCNSKGKSDYISGKRSAFNGRVDDSHVSQKQKVTGSISQIENLQDQVFTAWKKAALVRPKENETSASANDESKAQDPNKVKRQAIKGNDLFKPEIAPKLNPQPKSEATSLTQRGGQSDQKKAYSGSQSTEKRNVNVTKDETSVVSLFAVDKENSLAGWDNQLKPAPIGEEWEMRDLHNPMDAKHKAVVETWANDQLQGQDTNCPVIDIESHDFLTGQGIVEGDVVLQHAIEASFHDAIPDITTMNEPKRLMNAEDAIKEHMARYGVTKVTEPSLKQEKRDPITGLTKSERKEKLNFFRAAFQKPGQPNEYAPQANIYMRPAEVKDIPLITHLHNDYVENSVTTHFTKPSSVTMWRQILQECTEDACPFIVAILSQSNTRAMRAQEVKAGKFESVVGFAYAVDFGAPNNAFRVTLEIEIWIDPRFQHQGIGRTLLDRMLACLDPMYSFKDPAPFLYTGEPSKWMGGGHRIVQTLLITMLYSDDEKATMEWKKAWLIQNNFQVGSNIPAIGRKFRKQINMCQLYYTTGHDVSHIIR